MNLKEFFEQNKDFTDKRIFLIAASVVGMVIYTYFTSPVLSVQAIKSLKLIGELKYDLSQYIWRFILSFLCLGVLPFVTALLCGYKPSNLGICKPELKKPFVFWPILIGIAVVLGIISSFDNEVAAFYPYTKSLPVLYNNYGILTFIIHPLLYFVCFYIPWEIMFRGILVFPFINKLLNNTASKKTIHIESSLVFLIACFQAIPSALLHFGHPLSETLSALFFGIVAAIICVKTKSFIPVLVLHSIVGIFLDFSILIAAH